MPLFAVQTVCVHVCFLVALQRDFRCTRDFVQAKRSHDFVRYLTISYDTVRFRTISYDFVRFRTISYDFVRCLLMHINNTATTCTQVPKPTAAWCECPRPQMWTRRSQTRTQLPQTRNTGAPQVTDRLPARPQALGREPSRATLLCPAHANPHLWAGPR